MLITCVSVLLYSNPFWEYRVEIHLFWWVPLNILSLFYNKIYKTEYIESSIILNKIRSLLGGSSEHGFREHRPCYIHGRTHVGISDVAKCGKGIMTHQSNKIKLFTVTQSTCMHVCWSYCFYDIWSLKVSKTTEILTGSPIAPQPPISASPPPRVSHCPQGAVPPTLGTTGLDGSQSPVLGISLIRRTGCWLKSGFPNFSPWTPFTYNLLWQTSHRPVTNF